MGLLMGKAIKRREFLVWLLMMVVAIVCPVITPITQYAIWDTDAWDDGTRWGI